MLLDFLISRDPIGKGWSGDNKYLVTTPDGTKLLLRTSPADLYERRKRQFENMLAVTAAGVPICSPVEFGICAEGVYMLLDWVDGKDAEPLIPTLQPDVQYQYGLDAGRHLKRIHSIPAPENQEPWSSRYGKKIDRKIAAYENCPLKYEHGQKFLDHITRTRHLLSDRPQTYQHGDFHIGNMMIDKHGKLIIIDFYRDDWGDPWEEFNRIVWSAQAAPAFACGMVDGYFCGDVPHEFWELLALYISSNTLSSLPWALDFGEAEIRTMTAQAEEILRWYDGMNTVIPSWYEHK